MNAMVPILILPNLLRWINSGCVHCFVDDCPHSCLKFPWAVKAKYAAETRQGYFFPYVLIF